MFTIIDVYVLLFSCITIVLVKLLTDEARSPIFNVYQRTTKIYWFKIVFIYSILRIKQLIHYLKSERRRDLGKADTYMLLDKPQKLCDTELAVDSVSFIGTNPKGDYFAVLTARRKNNLVDGFLYLKINRSKVGLLESPKLPSTALYQLEETQEYKAEGIEITVIEPMSKWKVKYEGKMKRFEDRAEWHNVKFEGKFSSNLPLYNVDVDVDPFMTAKAIALEPWSRDYFITLNGIRQIHYHQFGDMSTHANIDGKTYDLKLSVWRDRSNSANKEWRIFHRYVAHFINVENGDRIMVAVISSPVSISSLTIGFIYSAHNGKIHALKKCDFVLHQHGENGKAPLDYGFSVHGGHRTYVVKVHVNETPHFYISKDWEAKVFERLCTFKVNGLKGWGGAEWMYRNIEGKFVKDYEKCKKNVEK